MLPGLCLRLSGRNPGEKWNKCLHAVRSIVHSRGLLIVDCNVIMIYCKRLNFLCEKSAVCPDTSSAACFHLILLFPLFEHFPRCPRTLTWNLFRELQTLYQVFFLSFTLLQLLIMWRLKRDKNHSCALSALFDRDHFFLADWPFFHTIWFAASWLKPEETRVCVS